jgi:predicted ABC-type ATPase
MENLMAAKLMLAQIDKYADERKSFAFETTFSGKIYTGRIKKLKQFGYSIAIFYIMLDDIETSLKRIQERVEKGGHNIPEDDARRRFSRSASNFLNLYSPLADEWEIYDNTFFKIRAVANKSSGGIQVFDESLYNKLKQNAKG